MLIDNLYNEIVKEVPLEWQLDFDNSGMQVFYRDEIINNIYISLDINSNIIDDAIKNKCNLIITHHPFIFKGLKKIDSSNVKDRILFKAIENKISILSLHTNLDKYLYNVLAEKIGLKNISALFKERDSEKGMGAVGEFPGGVLLKDLLLKVKTSLNSEFLRYSGDLNRNIFKIACLNGSGGREIEKLYNQGIDCIVTGDVGYHHMFDAVDNNFPVIDAGHFSTEIIFKEFISNIVLDCLTKLDIKHDLKVIISSIENDPFKIFY